MMPGRTMATDELVRASALASATERRNRSVTMLAVAVLVCIVSIFGTLASARDGAGARRSMLARVSQQERLLELEAQLSVLRESPEVNDIATRYKPELQLRAKLDRISSRLNLSPPANLGNTQDLRLGLDSPLVNKVLDVMIVNASAPSALRWIDLAQEEIPGLRVLSLEMRPTPQGWTFRIQMGRWEISQ